MDEAGIGGADHDERVVDYYANNHFTFDPAPDGGDLDDALRLAVAVWPAGADSKLDFRWAGTANDEPYDRIVHISHCDFSEVMLARLAGFAGKDVVEAVTHIATAASDALNAG